MKTKTEVPCPIVVPTDSKMPGPPTRVTLPMLKRKQKRRGQDILAKLGSLAQRISQVRTPEPTPKKRRNARTHSRPQRGFE